MNVLCSYISCMTFIMIFTPDIPQICPRYKKISPRYPSYMPKISQRCPPDISIYPHFCYFLQKRSQFLFFCWLCFLLTTFSRHCKVDLLHSLMLPPKGPALHIYLNNLKCSFTWKHQIKKTVLMMQYYGTVLFIWLCISISTTWNIL